MSKNKPHKWAKEIKAWADGATIQYRYTSVSSKWIHLTAPTWIEHEDIEYRIKPEEKFMYACQSISGSIIGISNLWSSLEDLKTLYNVPDKSVKCYIKFTLIDDVITKMEIVE